MANRHRVFNIGGGVSCGDDRGLGSTDDKEEGMGEGDGEDEGDRVSEGGLGIWMCCGAVNRRRQGLTVKEGSTATRFRVRTMVLRRTAIRDGKEG